MRPITSDSLRDYAATLPPAQRAEVERQLGSKPASPARKPRAASAPAPARAPLASSVTVLVPIRTVSEANTRGGWYKRAKRTKAQREMVGMYVDAGLFSMMPLGSLPALPVVVTLTRIGKRRLDSDNLASALKACRDGVADALNVDDGDPRLDWRYGQERGDPAVRVQIAPSATLASVTNPAGLEHLPPLPTPEKVAEMRRERGGGR